MKEEHGDSAWHISVPTASSTQRDRVSSDLVHATATQHCEGKELGQGAGCAAVLAEGNGDRHFPPRLGEDMMPVRKG